MVFRSPVHPVGQIYSVNAVKHIIELADAGEWQHCPGQPEDSEMRLRKMAELRPLGKPAHSTA
ncbi:hypothetical protein ACIQF6_33455 [Kitasatospora sp. NPDC092948]|uniref:hypothetical protein n=1 Tax=Kitasatospora sp. NPDC092948 TaxID=3364088 RepID=UPI003823023C